VPAKIALVPMGAVAWMSMMWMPLMSAGVVTCTPGTGIPPVAVDVKVPMVVELPAAFQTMLYAVLAANPWTPKFVPVLRMVVCPPVP